MTKRRKKRKDEAGVLSRPGVASGDPVERPPERAQERWYPTAICYLGATPFVVESAGPAFLVMNSTSISIVGGQTFFPVVSIWTMRRGVIVPTKAFAGCA